MTGVVPESADDGRLAPVMSIEELLKRLSAEFTRASQLPPVQRAKIRARLAAEMRELHAVLTGARVLAALKTEEFRKEKPEMYRQLFGDSKPNPTFEEGRV